MKFIYDSFIEGSSFQDIADSLTQQGIHSPMGMDKWNPNTIRSILKNEKYCGDVRYQKTYSKDYLSHKTVINKDVLPQWYWENNHPAIIKKEQWQKAQELLASGKRKSSNGKPAAVKRPVIAKVKSGVLAGYFLLDMDWSKEEREQFLTILNNINEPDDSNQEERN